MRISIMAALMAASALAPSFAAAQDRQERSGGGGAPHPQAPHQGGGRGAPSPGQARSQAPAPQQARPQQAAPQVPQPPRPQFNGGGRPDFSQRGPGHGVPQVPQGQPQQVRGQPGGQDRGQSQFRRGGDDRGNPGRQQFQGQQFQGQQFQGQQFQGQDRGNRASGGSPGQQSRPNDRNRGDYRGGWNGNAGRGSPQGWNRGWRGNGQYNWQSYRNSNRQAYRLPRYYAPNGYNYGYRPFGIGAYLDEMLYDQSYWIDDPYDYRLPPAYGPYRWVRYYNDALLVNIYTGEVVDEISGIFW